LIGIWHLELQQNYEESEEKVSPVEKVAVDYLKMGRGRRLIGCSPRFWLSTGPSKTTTSKIIGLRELSLCSLCSHEMSFNMFFFEIAQYNADAHNTHAHSPL
jgi:hypothetical protein